jgi:hypothetical protein
MFFDATSRQFAQHPAKPEAMKQVANANPVNKAHSKR